MNRCEECGSWAAQCASETPVKGCGCARCANYENKQLRKALTAIREGHNEPEEGKYGPVQHYLMWVRADQDCAIDALEELK